MSTEEWRTEWRAASMVTASGFTKQKYLTEEQIEEICNLISEGIPQVEAAKRCGTSSLQFTRRARKDPEVKKKLEAAKDEGRPEYENALRAEAYFQAFVEKNYKALRDQLLIHLPEYAPLTTHRIEVGNIDGESFKLAAMKALGPDISTEELDLVIKIFERQQAALPSAEKT